MPIGFGDAGQGAPHRGEAFGADREPDPGLVGGAGEPPGEVAGVGAQLDLFAADPAGQPGQGPRQQLVGGGAGVVDPAAQAGGQHGLGLGPRRHMRATHPLTLVVVFDAVLFAPVHLHIGGIQVDGDRALAQRGGPLRGQQRQHPLGHRGQPRFGCAPLLVVHSGLGGPRHTVTCRPRCLAHRR